jgi:hypothetical protein
MFHRPVSWPATAWGVRVGPVLKKYSPRRVPSRPRTNTQRIGTSPAPALYQCPAPSAVPTCRVPPPYQPTVSRRKRRRRSTAWRGWGKRSPWTRGRPLPAYGGGGANRLASGRSLLTSASRARWRWAKRATSWVP